MRYTPDGFNVEVVFILVVLILAVVGGLVLMLSVTVSVIRVVICFIVDVTAFVIILATPSVVGEAVVSVILVIMVGDIVDTSVLLFVMSTGFGDIELIDDRRDAVVLFVIISGEKNRRRALKLILLCLVSSSVNDF